MVHFILTKTLYMSFEAFVKIEFLGIKIEGNILITSTGGIVSGRLFGKGELKKLCSICPTFNGELEVKKTAATDTEPSVGSVRMLIDMEFMCFYVKGALEIDTAGGLKYFHFAASNPMCFLDALIETFGSLLGGGDEELEEGEDDPAGAVDGLRINAVDVSYGSAGSSLTIDLDLTVMGQRRVITIQTGEIDSVDALIESIGANALAIMDALDDVFNIFTLTFLGAPQVSVLCAGRGVRSCLHHPT